MGYGLGAPMKSAKAQKEMFEFMQANFKSALELFPEYIKEDYDNSEGGPQYGEDIVYDGKKLNLAFHYASWNVDRYYIWTLCRWMALKAGRRNKAGKPYIWYDGHARREVPEEDELGVQTGYVVGMMLSNEQNEEIIARTLAEMRRLDALWNERTRP